MSLEFLLHRSIASSNLMCIITAVYYMVYTFYKDELIYHRIQARASNFESQY